MDVPLPPVFARELPGVPVRFLHDSTAFLLGEAWQGAARDMENPAGVMLGTGFGFTVMQRRRVLVDANGTPALVLWNAPFRDGTVEDYVSRRALRDAYGPQAPDVRELAELARGGDTRAQAIFRRMGEALGEVLTRYLPAGTDGVVLGGQIGPLGRAFPPLGPDTGVRDGGPGTLAAPPCGVRPYSAGAKPMNSRRRPDP